MLKDKLHIYIITYNRVLKLKKTLQQIFSEDSPLKDLQITILDNASNDGTKDLINNFKIKFPNIEYIRHKINIGGNANIARALEKAASSDEDYFWILCDDDNYNFTNFKEVENAIMHGYDAIIVERKCDFSENDLPYIVNTMSFIPSTIYKRINLTCQVLQNAYCNIFLSFPHLALGCHLLNNKKSFYIGPQIIYQNINFAFVRGCNQDAHPRIKNVNLFSSYIASYQMIKDKKLREKCCNTLWIGKSFFYSIKNFLRSKPDMTNIFEVVQGLSLKQKIIFLAACFSQYFDLKIIFIALKLSLFE